MERAEFLFSSSNKKPKVIITGGFGVIGRELIKKLRALRIEFFIIGKDIVSERMRLEGCTNLAKPEVPEDKVFMCDIADYDKLEGVFENILKQCSKDDEIVVVHLAGALETLSVKEITDTNVKGTENISRICQKLGLHIVVSASSAKMYFPYYRKGEYKLIWDNKCEDINLPLPQVPVEKYDAKNEEFKAQLKKDLEKLFPTTVEQDYAYILSKIEGEAIAENFVKETKGTWIAMRLGHVNSFNKPPENNPAAAAVWLSHDDVQNFISACINFARSHENTYKAFHAISNNRYGWLDKEIVKKELGWYPQDSAEEVQAEEFSQKLHH